MTYRGHGVLHTLIRCRFSPEFSTGQKFIYTGCSTGKIVSKLMDNNVWNSLIIHICIISPPLIFFVVYDVLTGRVVCKLSNHDACVRDVSWHPYHNNMVSSSVSKTTIRVGMTCGCNLWCCLGKYNDLRRMHCHISVFPFIPNPLSYFTQTLHPKSRL